MLIKFDMCKSTHYSTTNNLSPTYIKYTQYIHIVQHNIYYIIIIL